MADFVARIRAELDTSGIKSQLKNIVKDQIINIKVNITGDTNVVGNIEKILSGATNSASNAGTKAGKAFANSMQRAINSGNYKYETGKFAADAAQFSQMLDRYQGQTSSLLAEARNFQSEYTSIFNELQDHFNGVNILNDKELVAKFQAIQKAGDSFKNKMREINTVASASTKIQLSNDIVDYMNNNTKAAKKYGEALKQLSIEAKNASTNGDISRVKDQFKELRSAISAEGLEGRSFLSELGAGFKKVGQFVGTYRMIMESIKAIKQMVKEVTAVDSALIELRKVSDATDKEIAQSLDAATASAKKYGAAISDVVSSQADWARLGYGVKEAQQLADVTTLFQTVGDNMTQESASQGLISILKGYQMDVSQAESIIDKLNEVANTSPIDTAGLTEALERSVSSMAAAGNTLDESIGLITAANAVVQDPATVGTAFKTLTMRIRGAKTELEEAGLDTDGMADSVSKLRNELLDLTGVDIQLDEDTFKSTYQILKELSEVWDDLSDVSRANVTELIAGKRQGNIISALMTNFDIAEQVSNTSAHGSEGSAQKELENYQKGIEYSLGKFKASFQELSVDFIGSDLVKGVVDFGTILMNGLDAVIGKIGALKTVLGGLGIAAIATDFMGLRTAIVGLPELLGQLPQVLTAIKSAGVSGGLLFSEMQLGISAASVSLAGFIAVALGIAGIVALVDHFTESFDEVTEEADDAIASYKEAKEKLSEVNAELETTQTRMAELEGKTLSAVEQAEYDRLVEYNQRLLEQKEILEAIAESKGETSSRKSAKALTKESYYDSGEVDANYDTVYKKGTILDQLSDQTKHVSDLKSQYENLSTTLDEEREKEAELEAKIAAYPEDQRKIKWFEDTPYEEDKSALKDVRRMIKLHEEEQSKLGDDLIDAQESRDELAEQVSTYRDALVDSDGNVVEEFQDVYDAAGAVLDAIKSDSQKAKEKSDDIKKVLDEHKDAYNRLLKMARSREGGISVSDLFRAENRDLLDAIFGAGFNPEDVVAEVNSVLDEIGTEITTKAQEVASEIATESENSSTLIKNIKAAQDALDSQKTGKSLDEATFDSKELVEYRSALEYVNGTLQYNAEKVKELTKAKVEDQIATNELKKAEAQTTYKENAEEIARLRETLSGLDKGTDDYKNTLAKLATLQSDNSGLVSQCEYLDLLNARLREATGSYQEWLDAQNAPRSGDMASDVRSAIKDIKNVWDSSSDEHDRFGSPVYTAAVDFLVPEEISEKGREAVKSYIDNLGKYFNGEQSGVDNFVLKGFEEGLFEKTEEGLYKVADGVTMEDFAERLGWTPEAVQAMFGEFQEFYPEADLSWITEDSFNTDPIENAKEVLKEYIEIAKEMEQLNIDPSETVFGNIDTNNRQVLEWTKDNVEKYKEILKAWGENPDEIEGMISTVMGSSQWVGSEEGGAEIAFSPMLQTDHGAELLTPDTVTNYLEQIYEKAGEGASKEDILSLDAEGLEIEGQHIQGLIADIGETALDTGEKMHYVGKDGALQSTADAVEQAVQATGLSLEQLNEMGDNELKVALNIEDEDELEATKSALEEIYNTSFEKSAKDDFQSSLTEGLTTLEEIGTKAKDIAEDLIFDIKIDENGEFESALDGIKGQYEQWKSDIESDKVQVSFSTGEEKEQAVENNPLKTQTSALQEFDETGRIIPVKIEVDSSDVDEGKSKLEDITNTTWVANADLDMAEIQKSTDTMREIIESNPMKQKVEFEYEEYDPTGKGSWAEAREQRAQENNKTDNPIIRTQSANTEGITPENIGQSTAYQATVEMKADTSNAEEGIEQVGSEVDALDGKTATAQIQAELGNSIPDVRQLNNEINSLPSIKTTIIETIKRTKNEGDGDLNGNAHVRGTAFSGGKWGAKKTETALVGELGREIVVDPRTGQWHTVGDNGAEFETIPRGAIVFNHEQTEALLSRGFVNGRGSAFIGGTAYGFPAGDAKVRSNGFAIGSSTSSTNSNTSAQKANTKATKDNTKEKGKNTTKAKKLGDMYDWVAVRLKDFADKTKEIADKINDYINSATKSSLLAKQIGANQNEIGANQYAAWLYKDQADTIAKKTGMSKKLITKAQSGAWQFENLSSKDRENVQTYLKYYDKYKEAEQSVRSLRNEQLELYEQWVNIPAEEAAKKVDKLTKAMTLLGNAYNLATSGASALAQYVKVANRSSGTKNSKQANIARSSAAGYQAGNRLLDEQLNNSFNQMTSYETAYNTATRNAASAKSNITSTRNAATAAKNAVTARAKSILSNKSIAKKLTKAQKEALKKGQAINTKGLSGNVLKQVKAYNTLVSKSITAANSAEDAVTKYTIATKAQEEALQQLAESQEEYAQMVVENEKKKFDNIKNFYDLEINMQKQIAENYAKEREYREAYGSDLVDDDFTNQIDALDAELTKMTAQRDALDKQLANAVSSKKIIEGSEEWDNMKNQILAINGAITDLKKNILDIQDEWRKGVFYQALDKALKKAEELRGSLSTIRDIIAEEMLFDDDGHITDFGITSLAMDVKEYESYLDSMGTLLEKRQKYIDAFGDGEGKNDTNYSQKEFDEDMAAIEKDIQDLLKNATSTRKAIIDMVVKTSKAELDALMDVIDARKELLKKQKDYYDYDKSLKSKTKDIQLLEQQERALQNSADAEDKAMLARIRAQKQEAQEALDDTVREHVYNLQVDGLDDLKADLKESYDNYVKDLSRNLDLITEAVNGATDTVTQALSTVNSTVKTLLNSYGVDGLNASAIGLPTFAGGTRRVGRNTYGLTNERGGEIVVGDRGIFFPLSASSSVMKPELTNNLFDLANNYQDIMRVIGNNGVMPTIQGNERNTISPIINAPISITGNQIDEQGVIRAINKQLPVISRTVQNDIRKDLRKSR